MKRMILVSLIGLLASGAYASDLSYRGPYSQLKVKLCSDTPPSRSILPDGSLVCDGETDDPDAYCVGGFNYADSDIFNCGTKADNTGDLNGNGIPDSEEDWDGDGIINSEDHAPFENDERYQAEDLNGDGIPDNLESVFEKLNTNVPEIIQCDSSDSNCNSYNAALRQLAFNNRELARIISKSSLSGLTSDRLKYEMERLKKHETTQAEHTRLRVDNMNYYLDTNLRNINGNVYDLDRSISKQRHLFSDLDKKLDEHSDELGVYLGEQFRQLIGNSNTNYSYNKDIYNNSNDLKTGMSEVQSRTGDILNLLNENSGGSGLTDTQKKQLKNAAKANANNKLLREQKSKMESLETALSNTSDIVSNLEYGVYEALYELPDYTAKSVETTLAPRFDSLDSAIASLSSASSSIDLSGVESSIDVLSDKIDGIEGGGNGEGLAEISGKLDGLATGVTDIGDLLKGVDASKAGIDGTCIQGGTCKGFYESAYEGDLSTVVNSQLDSMKISIVDPFVSSFGNIDLSGAQRPKFGLPVPFYGYMSFDNYIDMDWIFGFIRFIFLASTAFYCRQIIFGG